MSIQPCNEPVCGERGGAVATVIEPRARDLGDFSVRRVLPSAARSMVGPFVFFDEMGPARFAPGTGMDVRPHPHIGLSTITWLFEGEVMHRDSLGFAQPIRPGAVNWMTAGRGIVHSERTPAERRAEGLAMHGIQAWIALPESDQETEPSFQHYAASEVPWIERAGARLAVVAGEAYGAASPVETFSPLFYVDASLEAGSVLEMPGDYPERAVYVVSGALEVDGERHAPQRMIVLAAGASPSIRATEPSRLMLLGGEPVGPRTIWWNFVSSRRERIEQAKSDWREGRFGRVAGETEFIPLPDE